MTTRPSRDVASDKELSDTTSNPSISERRKVGTGILRRGLSDPDYTTRQREPITLTYMKTREEDDSKPDQLVIAKNQDRLLRRVKFTNVRLESQEDSRRQREKVNLKQQLVQQSKAISENMPASTGDSSTGEGQRNVYIPSKAEDERKMPNAGDAWLESVRLKAALADAQEREANLQRIVDEQRKDVDFGGYGGADGVGPDFSVAGMRAILERQYYEAYQAQLAEAVGGEAASDPRGGTQRTWGSNQEGQVSGGGLTGAYVKNFQRTEEPGSGILDLDSLAAAGGSNVCLAAAGGTQSTDGAGTGVLDVDAGAGAEPVTPVAPEESSSSSSTSEVEAGSDDDPTPPGGGRGDGASPPGDGRGRAGRNPPGGGPPGGGDDDDDDEDEGSLPEGDETERKMRKLREMLEREKLKAREQRLRRKMEKAIFKQMWTADQSRADAENLQNSQLSQVTDSVQIMAEALTKNRLQGGGRVNTSDLKGRQFDALPKNKVGDVKGILAQQRGQEDWQQEVLRVLQLSFPRDADRYWSRVVESADKAHMKAIIRVADRRASEQGLLPDLNSFAEYETEDSFLQCAPGAGHENLPEEVRERDSMLEAVISTAMTTALPKSVTSRGEKWFGKIVPTATLLYLWKLELYKDIGFQRSSIEEEFRDFKLGPSEGALAGWIRFESYRDVMTCWEIDMPDSSQVFKIVEGIFQGRLAKLPSAPKWKWSYFMAMMDHSALRGKNEHDYEKVWIYARKATFLITENPVAADEEKHGSKGPEKQGWWTSRGCWNCGDKGHWSGDCKKPKSTPDACPAGTPVSQVQCFECGSKGHWARDCPKKKPASTGAASTGAGGGKGGKGSGGKGSGGKGQNPCFDFQKGSCSRGAECKYSHDPKVVGTGGGKKGGKGGALKKAQAKLAELEAEHTALQAQVNAEAHQSKTANPSSEAKTAKAAAKVAKRKGAKAAKAADKAVVEDAVAKLGKLADGSKGPEVKAVLASMLSAAKSAASAAVVTAPEKKGSLARRCTGFLAQSAALSSVVTKDWFASDTGATDVFANPTHNDDMTRTHPVGVTDGSTISLEENQHGEMMVKGTQLMPAGKCCAEGLRGQVWMPGETEPIFDEFTDEETALILAICRNKKRLPTVNVIPYHSPEESEILRVQLREKRNLEQYAHMSVKELWEALLAVPEPKTRPVVEIPAKLWPHQPTHKMFETEYSPEFVKQLTELDDRMKATHVRFDYTPTKLQVPGGITVNRTKEVVPFNQRNWDLWRTTICYQIEHKGDVVVCTPCGQVSDELFGKNRCAKIPWDLKGLPYATITLFHRRLQGAPGGVVGVPPRGQVDNTTDGSVSGPQHFDIYDSQDSIDAGETDPHQVDNWTDFPAFAECYSEMSDVEALAAHVETKGYNEACSEAADMLAASVGSDSVWCDQCYHFDFAPKDDSAEPASKGATSKGVAEPAEKVARPARRARVLPACDQKKNSHQDGMHVGSQPECDLCQEANLRSRQHRRSGKRLELGGLSIDLAERVRRNASVQFVLVAVSTSSEHRKIVTTEALLSKDAQEIKRGLMLCILRSEHVWGMTPVLRVHGDKESGLRANQEWLHSNAISLTTTEGYDSQANALAESMISTLAAGARTALVQASKNLQTKEQQRLLSEALWHEAMSFSASLRSAAEVGLAEVDPKPKDNELRPARLQVIDFEPFCSKVLFRVGRVKAEKDEQVATEGWYLGPDLEIPNASRILEAEEPYKIRKSTTVRAVQREGKPVFPENGIGLPAEKERSEEDEIFWSSRCWIECELCKKWRLATIEEAGSFKGRQFKCELLHGGRCAAVEDHRAWDDDATRKLSGRDRTAGPRKKAKAIKEKRPVGRPPAMQRVANLSQILDVHPSQFTNRTSKAFQAMLDWSSEEACMADEAQYEASKGAYELEELDVKWEKGGKAYWSSLHGGTSTEGLPNEEVHRAHVVKVLNIKEAKERESYEKTVTKELGSLMDLHCWGKPQAWSGVPEDALIFKGKMIYGVKHWEIKSSQKDKARIVVQGVVRVTKAGKVQLEKFFKQPGEFWAPTSSMAGLRFVTSIATIQGRKVMTIDLDSGYIQSTERSGNTFLWFPKEIIEMMGDDWRRAYDNARLEDIEAGGQGWVLFPLIKNLYGKSDSGTNFIQDFQESLEQMLGWKALPHCHGCMVKHDPSQAPRGFDVSVLANYVDDLAVVLTPTETEQFWTILAKRWRFDKQYPLVRFLGIKAVYPLLTVKGDHENAYADAVAAATEGSEELRLCELHQSEYLQVVVERYEATSGKNIRAYRTLPAKEPEESEETNGEAGTIVRSAVAGIMYGARGTRMDLPKATNVMACRVTRWNTECLTFLEHLLGYIKGTPSVRLRYDARGESRDVREWRYDISADADFKPKRTQTGIVLCLVPLRDDGFLRRFLSGDWTSTGQSFAKLSAPESESVAAVHALRVGLRMCDTWWAITHPETWQGEGQRTDPLIDIPECVVLRQREDNTACLLLMKRGWSAKMIHLPSVYCVSVAWAAERTREGRVEWMKEATGVMLADPLTKLMKADILYEAKILVDHSSDTTQ